MTHRQYEELRTYPTEPNQRTVYRHGGHMASLLASGYLHEDRDGAVVVTQHGKDAMHNYRERYGIRERAAS
jgi:hypothetical protein